MKRANRWTDIAKQITRTGAGADLFVPASRLTTYRLGGPVALVVSITKAEQAIALGSCISDDVNVIVIGNGSNILISDNGYEGVAVVLNLPDDETMTSVVESTGTTALIDAAANIRLPLLARRTAALGWSGLEWAVGVPGSLGGAVRMNAGGHGSDMASTLLDAELINLRNGHTARIASQNLGLRFRGSAMADEMCIVSARCQVTRGNVEKSQKEIAAIVAWRREHQPGGQNAGSVFVNPAKTTSSAGALIDEAGLRGTRHGTAEISQKHANFIQADENTSAADVVALMCEAQDVVFARTGVMMHSEIRLLGFAPEISARFQDRHRVEPEVVRAEEMLKSLL
ncbi:MAG: UDP-N-acetylmuramate dehydrogenase [Ilumatobacteraceae bacterium]|nr:UDP-N-acetylmuramate dehydrogenase [Ilumatobacteraceae bacterium]